MAGDILASRRDVRGGVRGGRVLPPAVVVSDVPVRTSRFTTKLWYLDPDDDESTQESDGNFFGADLFRQTESALAGSSGSSVSGGSSDEETDLDDVPEMVEAVGRPVTDRSPGVGAWTYGQACDQLNVARQTAVTEGLGNEQLNLAGRNLGPRDLIPLAKALQANVHLSSLDLSGNGASGAAMLELANSLRWNNTVRKLNLSDNQLGVFGAAAIAEVMQHNTGITTLDLSHNNFDDEAAKYVGQGIEATDRVANLDLSYNSIGETGGLHLGAGLEKSESVQILDLSWNKLRGQGGVKVIQGIQKNMVTTHVNLAHNGLGYEGALALKQLLKAGGYLVSLDVTANRINWNSIAFITDGIKVNENLEVLKIGKNPLTTHGCMELIDAVSSPNCCIRHLDITDQPVTRDFVIIAQAIKQLRDFEFKHGGLVSCPDVLGRREGVKVEAMKKLADFIRDNRIRSHDLFKMISKNTLIHMPVDEFITGLKNTGIELTEEDIEAVMGKMTPRMERNNEIGYSTLLNTMKAQWMKERHAKQAWMKEQEILRAYHGKLLNPQLPPIEDDTENKFEGVVKKFQRLLRHQSVLPPIVAGSGRSSPAAGNQQQGSSHSDLRKMAPGVMSLTRPIGAKSKPFGTDVKKKRKKKRKSHIKAKRKIQKKKTGTK